MLYISNISVNLGNKRIFVTDKFDTDECDLEFQTTVFLKINPIIC